MAEIGNFTSQSLNKEPTSLVDLSAKVVEERDQLYIDTLNYEQNTPVKNVAPIEDIARMSEDKEPIDYKAMVSKVLGRDVTKAADPDYLSKVAKISDEEDTSSLAKAGKFIGEAGLGMATGFVLAPVEMLGAAELAVEGMIGFMGSDVDLPFDQWVDSTRKELKSLGGSTTAGSVAQGITQFLTGFVPIFRALNTVKSLGVGYSAKKVIMADALTGATVLTPEDPNAFNLVKSVEFLKPLDSVTGGAISEYFATDPNDSEAKNRLRNGLAGVLEGQAFEHLFKGLSFVSKEIKGAVQGKLGILKDRPKLTPEALEAEIAELKADYKKARGMKGEGYDDVRKSIQNAIRRNKRQLARLTEPDQVVEEAFDHTMDQVARDAQESIQIESKDLKGVITGDLGEALTKNYERLPKKIRGATPRFFDQTVNFKDDITKSIYIVTDKNSLANNTFKSVKNRSKAHGEYVKYLTETVGMDESEVFEIGRRIQDDLMSGNNIGSVSTYRREIAADIEDGVIEGVNVTYLPKSNPGGLRNMNTPMSELGDPLIKPVREEIGEEALEAVSDSPLLTKILFRGDENVALKKGMLRDNIRVTKTTPSGEPKYVFKSKKTGKWFQIDHGKINTPNDVNNMFNYLRREMGDDGFGERVKLKEVEAKAIEEMPKALSWRNKKGEIDPFDYLVNERGIDAQTAMLARVIHGSALENLVSIARRRAAGDMAPELKNDYMRALAYWANAYTWQGNVARKSSQATRAFGHPIESNIANAEIINRIIKESVENSEAIPFSGGLDTLSKMIAKTDNMKQANGAIEAVMNKSGVISTMIEHYLGVGLLSGMSTQVANLLGGVGVAAGTQPVEKALSSAFKRMWGFGDKGTIARDLMDNYVALFESIPEAVKVSTKTLIKGEPTGFAASKMEITKPTITGESVIDAGADRVSMYHAVGQLNRGGTRMLLAGDDFVRTMIHRREVNKAAIKQARFESVDGASYQRRYEFLKENPEALKDYNSVKIEAQKLGDEATFTEQTQGLTAALASMADRFPAIRLFTPFIKVMYNLPKYFLSRDPITQGGRALLSKEFRDKLATDINFRSNFAARMTTGTAMLGTAVYYASQGKITGSTRYDYKKEKNKNMINHFSKSIRVDMVDGGVKSIDYSRLEPWASTLQYAADLVEILPQVFNESQQGELVSQAVWALSENLVSDTWAPGLTELLNLAQGKHTEREVEAVLKRLASSVTPAISREIARGSTPDIKETKGGRLNLYDDKFVEFGSKAGERSFEELLLKTRSTLPGFNGFSKRDRWGDVMFRRGSESDDPINTHPWEYLAAWTVRRQGYDEVDEYMDKLEITMSDIPQAIKVPGYGADPIELSPLQYEQLVLLSTRDTSSLDNLEVITAKDVAKLADQPSIVKQRIRTMINDPEFKMLKLSGFGDGFSQKEEIKAVFSEHRQLGKDLLLGVEGNENLVQESIRRREILEANPDVLFN